MLDHTEQDFAFLSELERYDLFLQLYRSFVTDPEAAYS